MLASRGALQLLEEAVVKAYSGKAAAKASPADRQDKSWPKHIPIKSSPLSSITLSDQSRVLSGIPESAVFFCCSYPLVRDDEITEAGGGERGGKLNFKEDFEKLLSERYSERAIGEAYQELESDPFFKFLTLGSLIYFDIEYRIVAINCFSFTELEEGIVRREKETHTKLSYKIYFGRKSMLPTGAIRPLAQYERWEKVSVDIITILFKFTHFSWIKPSEFLGDHVFPKNGGFAYLDERSRTGVFYPIVQPHEERTTPPPHTCRNSHY